MQTDVGAVRERNEDAAYVDPAGRFMILADGMGGHSAGDVASRMAVDGVRASLEEAADDLDAFARAPTDDGRDWIVALLDCAVRRANDAVFDRGRREADKHGMGTTLDVLVVLAGEAFVAHVGDSRTYLVREGELHQATADHTVARALQRAGTLTPEQAASSPMRSVLANALGILPRVAIDHVHLELAPGDRLLMCSDGLYDYFEDDELAAQLDDASGPAALAYLIGEARDRGGHDNITGIVIEIDRGTRPGASARPNTDFPDDDLDDAVTAPVALPPDEPPGPPLAGVGERTLTSFVEHALRESSRPHAVPD